MKDQAIIARVESGIRCAVANPLGVFCRIIRMPTLD